jgi:hypothetical protein
MIKVQIDVRNEIGRFTVAVRAENLKQATRIARDLYPRSTIEIAFPIEPDGFFAAASHHDGHFGLEGAKRPGEHQNYRKLSPLAANFSVCNEASSGVR